MKKKEYCSLGVMSGTSLDGLDFSLIKTDGISKIQELFNEYFKFNVKFKDEIKSLIWKFNKFDERKILNSEEFKVLNKRFSELVIKKIKKFLLKHSIKISSVDVIGVHGNTMLHNPKKGISIQLGDPIYMSSKLNVKIVSSFRDEDLLNKGQGAPLVPIYHQIKFAERNRNIMVVNIGGISNFSFLIGKKKLFASDIGPGNKLIDEYCNLNLNCDFDKDGHFSSKGVLIKDLVESWKKKNFLKSKFPTSYDNSFFKIKDYVKTGLKNHYDILRTLTFFSAYIISCLSLKINTRIDKWIFTGGGIKNHTLMKDLNFLLGKKNVGSSLSYDLDPFFIESNAFAFISVRTLKKLPSSFPNTTGCKRPSVSGNVYF